MNTIGISKLPTHVDMGAPGLNMCYVNDVPEYVEASHRAHEAGWTTYGLFENDAFICLDCGTILIERLT